jgi:syntaxin 1B/2/3
MSSNRYGESRAAYREVQERHQDIKRIEQTISELAQLFNDVRFKMHRRLRYLCSHHYFQMSMMVEQQDDTINTIQATAELVEKDMESG